MKRMWSRNELLRLSDAEIRKLIEDGEIENAKPIYYHPIAIHSKNGGNALGNSLSIVILNNSNTPFTLETLLKWVADNNITYLSPASGSIWNPTSEKRLIISWVDFTISGGSVTYLRFRGHYTEDVGDTYLREFAMTRATFLDEFNIGDTGVNKIN